MNTKELSSKEVLLLASKKYKLYTQFKKLERIYF